MTAEYNLDFPEDELEAKKAFFDPSSRHYAYQRPPKFDLFEFLPYKTASLQEWGEHLSNVVKHIYIAIKSGDLMGTVPVTAEELKEARRGDISETNFLPIDVNYCGTKASEYDGVQDPITLAMPIGKVEEPTIVSLIHWTSELRRILETKDLMPVKLRAALMKVFYAVVFSRGQEIDLQFFVDTLKLLKRGYKAELIGYGLILPWEPLLKEFEAKYARPDCPVENHSPFTEDLLLDISRVSSDFFDPEDTEKIVQSILTDYSSSNPACALPLIVPVHFKPVSEYDGQPVYHKNDARRYLAVFLQLRKQHPQSTIYVTSFCCKVAMNALEAFVKDPEVAYWGDYGVFTRQQFSGLVASVRSAAVEQGPEANQIADLCSAILYSLTNSCLEPVFCLIETIRSYASADDASEVSQVVKHLCHALRDRVAAERASPKEDYTDLPDHFQLQTDTVSSIVTELLSVALLGVTRHDAQASHYIEGVAALAEVSPEQVLDSFLLKMYSASECLESSSMVLESLAEQMFTMLPFLVASPIYRVHVIRLLNLLSEHIDEGTLFEFQTLLEAVIRFAYLIPFRDLGGDGGVFALEFTNNHISFLEKKISDPNAVFDTSGEVKALKSATSQFAYLVRSLLEKYFAAVSCQSDYPVPFASFVSALCSSASDEIFEQVQDIVYTHVATSYQAHWEQVAGAVTAIVTRNPALFGYYFEFLDARIRQEVLNGALKQEIDTRDDGELSTTELESGSWDLEPVSVRLRWYIEILNGAVAGAPSEILKFSQKLNNLIHFLHTKVRPAPFYVSYLLRAVLKSLSSLSLLDTCLISDASLESWDATRLERLDEKSLKFGWHIPQRSHIECALQVLEMHVSNALAEIESLVSALKDCEDDSELMCHLDDANIHFWVIRSGLGGICELYDCQPRSLEVSRLSLEASANSVSRLCRGFVLDENDPLYKRLHAFRAMVGQHLHRLVSEGVTTSNESLLKGFTHCLEEWTLNVGREVVGPRKEADTIRSQVNDPESSYFPMTRKVLSLRLRELHLDLLALSTSGRSANELDLMMLEGLLKIVGSPCEWSLEEAQNALSECISNIFGAASAVYNVFTPWKEEQRWEVALHYIYFVIDDNVSSVVFKGDRNLEALDLFAQSLKLSKLYDTEVCDLFFSAISRCALSPPTVCLINDELVDAIKPADVLSEIEALKAAKMARHNSIRDNVALLQDKLIEHSEIFRVKKGLIASVELVASLMLPHYSKLSESSFKFVTQQVQDKDLEMATRALTSLGLLFERISSEARYGYDLAQMYEGGDKYNTVEVETSANFASELKAHSPKFFIDNADFAPSLCWPEKLTVVKASRPPPLKYSDSHLELLHEVGSQFTREVLFKNFGGEFASWPFVKDVREKNAMLISSLILMGLTPVSVSDYLSVAQDILSEDAANHTTVSNMYAGMMLCYDLMSDSDRELADKMIAASLRSILSTISDLEIIQCWVTFVLDRVGPKIDLRRFPCILRAICDFSISEENISVDRARLFILATYISILGPRFHGSEILFERIYATISYPDSRISFQNACLLANLFENYPRQLPSWDELIADPCFDSLPDQPFETLEKILKQISHFRIEVGEDIADLVKLSESKYRWATEFMLNFLGSLRTPQLKLHIAQRLDSQLTEFIIGVGQVTDQFVQNECQFFFKFLGSLDLDLMPSSKLARMLFTCGGGTLPNFESHLLEHALKFVSARVSVLSVDILNVLMESAERLMTTRLDGDAAVLFTFILKAYPVDYVEEVVDRYAAKYVLLLQSEGPKSHGAVLGLDSLLDVHAYTVPPPKWLPGSVDALARFVQRGQYRSEDIGEEAAKLALYTFKTSKKYIWKTYCKFFTTEQLECFNKIDFANLENNLSPEFDDFCANEDMDGLFGLYDT